ncbi:hypothetical protein F511_46984 [Dorcoceras hygrometricum]|uniref:Uncharacterized protein n=1 Tax=Dorcoceras hygrometricum TaxID=472368 RepID=A0A2Z6ZS61_9LAMI|nr:hypothetical protein F511_46984 [Dorcoceras hygrometricum]
METSRVDSVVRNQAEAKLNQLEHDEPAENDISSDVIIQQELQCSADEDSADEKICARYGMSCDDISLDVITISSWLSADEERRKRRCDVALKFSR